MFEACKQRNVFAVCGQETRRVGNEHSEQDGFTFLGSAPDSQSRHGSCGVSITLSPPATAAWKRAGCEIYTNLGPRLMAVRLEVRGGNRGRQYHRKMGIFLVSGYHPT